MKGHPVPSHYLSNDCFVTIILVPWLVIVGLLISGLVVSVIITLMIRRLSSWDIRIISKGLLVTSTSTGSMIIFLVIIVIRGVILLSLLIVRVKTSKISVLCSCVCFDKYTVTSKNLRRVSWWLFLVRLIPNQSNPSKESWPRKRNLATPRRLYAPHADA